MAVPAETATSCLLFEQFFCVETEGAKVFGENTRPRHSLDCQVVLLPFRGKGSCLRQPAFTFDSLAFVSFIFRDRSRRKEAVVSRMRGLDWSWSILAAWADDTCTGIKRGGRIFLGVSTGHYCLTPEMHSSWRRISCLPNTPGVQVASPEIECISAACSPHYSNLRPLTDYLCCLNLDSLTYLLLSILLMAQIYVLPPEADQRASPDRARKSPVDGSMGCKMQGCQYSSGLVIAGPSSAALACWSGPHHLFAVYCAGFRTPTD